MQPLATVVLAAGMGRRMASELPKVLHPFAGRPLIEYLVAATMPLSPKPMIMVVGHQAERVKAALNGKGVEFVLQAEQLGTGHAVMQTRSRLTGFEGTVLVLVGDAPLLQTVTLREFIAGHERSGAACTLLSARMRDPSNYGRVIRDDAGRVIAIVEEKDASPEQLDIAEINSGIIAFASGPLWAHIDRLGRRNVQGEYYLTDLVSIFRDEGLHVDAHCVEDEWEVKGINSLEQLEELERIYRERQASRGESH